VRRGARAALKWSLIESERQPLFSLFAGPQVHSSPGVADPSPNLSPFEVSDRAQAMGRRALAPFLTFHRSLAAQSLTFRPVSCCSEKLNQPSNLNPNKKNLEGRATCRTCPQAVDRSTKSASLMLGVSTQSCSLVTASDVPKEWPPRAAMSLDPLTLRSASPHSPHLFDGIGPRTDWPKFKSEMRCESTWQCQTAHLPVPSENLLGETSKRLMCRRRAGFGWR
jgi:hypothetical protein